MTQTEWIPATGSEVIHRMNDRVGRVRAINPATSDEALIAWALGRETWTPIRELREYPDGRD